MIKIKPLKWYLYLNPKWWRYKKVTERLVTLNLLEQTDEIAKCISDTMIYGTGVIKFKEGEK